MAEQQEKRYADVASIVLCNDGITAWYTDEYKKRYACWQLVRGDALNDIAQNLKFFDELDKQADKLKVVMLNIECHGEDIIVPDKQIYLLNDSNPMFINNVKMYLRELKKFLLKHKHIKLYINHDVCYGARAYVVKNKNGYKIGDLFEDYKTELDGVLDRVAVAGFQKDVLTQTIPANNQEGIKRFNRAAGNGYLNLIVTDDDFKRLYKVIRLLTMKIAKEQGIKFSKDQQEVVWKEMFIYLFLPKILETSRKNNARKYYYFDKDGNLKKFDKNSEKAKAMKNEFLGIKKQKTQKLNKPLSLEEVVGVYMQKYKEWQSIFNS